MQKHNLYLIISIIFFLLIFTTAAVCNQCQYRPPENGSTVSPEDKDKDNTTGPDTGAAGTTTETTEETIIPTTPEEGDGQTPTIELGIDEGPIYSQADNICSYVIKASVTGEPQPEVIFSRDDSNGTCGQNKAKIELSDPSQSCDLTATATNVEGSDDDSITITWECNRPPEISQIAITGDHYIGLEYSFTAEASDPDGDSLSYNWSVSGGSIADPDTNPVNWTMPQNPGDYEIGVIVQDGNGGQAEMTETVQVLDYPVKELEQVSGGGFIEKNTVAIAWTCALVGDSDDNRPLRGFLSFDISSLAGKTVVSATMEFDHFDIENNPEYLIEKIWLDSVYWGTGDIETNYYDISGVMLGEYDIPAFKCSSQRLVDELNKAIIDGKNVFQVRLRHKGYQSNNNGIEDTIKYGGQLYPVEFSVVYHP